MSLQRVVYVDEQGRKKYVLLPEGASSEEAAQGIPVGPPNLGDLGLPLELEVRLNNELFARDIITPVDALRRRQEMISALQSALKLDVNNILTLYVGRDYVNASTPEKQPDAPVHHRRPRQPRK